jgi:hypothetical protein
MNMKNWYVYKITFNDESFYIGYRGTKRPVDQDFLVRYFSSSKIVRERIKNGECHRGEILAIFDQQQTSYEFEQQRIYDNFGHPLILNQSCYFGRKGFGILTESARQKISKRSKELWSDPKYREYLTIKRKESWTEDRKKQQSLRLSGQKRPDHSKLMKSRPVNPKFIENAKSPRSTKHKQAISESLKGKKKSEEHKQKLKKPKPLTVCRIHDKRQMAIGNFMNWYKRQNLTSG